MIPKSKKTFNSRLGYFIFRINNLSLLILLLFAPKISRSDPDNYVIVHLTAGCGFGEPMKDHYKCLSAPDDIEQLVVRMINFSGLKYNRIHVFVSDEVETAMTGPNDEGFMTTIINGKFVGNPDKWRAKIVLAHELGHVFYRDPDITRKRELIADDFSGFWSRKAHLPDSTLISEVIRSSPLPDSYPTYDERVKSAFVGWAEAAKPFEPEVEPNEENTSANKFRKLVDFLITVTPQSYTYLFKTYQGNKVRVHLVSADRRLEIDSVVKEIDHVLYVFGEKTFKHPYQPSKNPNNDNYGFNLTRVTVKFPMVCVIYFKDGSAFSLIKDLHLENIDATP